MMTAIFGDKAKNELFSTRNKILILIAAKGKFDKDVFVIVPDMKDSPSEVDVGIH
jgi:hypothetical protein